MPSDRDPTICHCKHCRAMRARAKVIRLPKLPKQYKSLPGQRYLFPELESKSQKQKEKQS